MEMMGYKRRWSRWKHQRWLKPSQRYTMSSCVKLKCNRYLTDSSSPLWSKWFSKDFQRSWPIPSTTFCNACMRWCERESALLFITSLNKPYMICCARKWWTNYWKAHHKLFWHQPACGQELWSTTIEACLIAAVPALIQWRTGEPVTKERGVTKMEMKLSPSYQMQNIKGVTAKWASPCGCTDSAPSALPPDKDKDVKAERCHPEHLYRTRCVNDVTAKKINARRYQADGSNWTIRPSTPIPPPTRPTTEAKRQTSGRMTSPK